MKKTADRFLDLMAKGPKQRCSRTGTYYHLSEMRPDGRGGYIAKKFDCFIHDETTQLSKFRKGKGWFRPETV